MLSKCKSKNFATTSIFIVMKKFSLSFLVALCATTIALSQKISGNVTDNTQKPQEFATILLQNAKDSSLVKGAVTDIDGHFEIENVAAGTYIVSVNIVGFKPYTSEKFDFDGTKDTPLSIPALATLDKELAQVTVTAQKPMIEVKADRTIFNVEATPTAQGLNALELLRRSPGVNLDKDDNVMLKGRSNVQVYINDKPSQMSGKDLASFLKGLNSNDIEAIEIISNPGAKYDAEGTGGIVNIKLKKNKKLGTNGNLSLGANYGITPKYDGSVSLNYRDAKINAFGSFSANNGRYYNYMNLVTTSGDVKYKQEGDQYWFDNSRNFKAGLDFFANSKHTFGVLFNGSINNPRSESVSYTPISRISTGKIDSILTTNNNSEMHFENLNYNANYRFADTLGHTLNIDLDYGTFRNTSEAYLPNIYLDPESNKPTTVNIYRNATPTNIDIRSAKTDYEQILWKGKFGAGLKFSDVVTDNTFEFYNVKNDVSKIDTNRTNKFEYKEQIAAAYLNYSKELTKKWGLQLGLRAEHTRAKGDLTSMRQLTQSEQKNIDTSYLNIFPTASLSYTLNPKHAFNLTYRYAIDRPDYKDLNPFENQIDELSFEKGNPFIRPQYSSSIELGYIVMQAANLTVGYGRTEGFFTQVTDMEFDNILNKNRFFITKRNLATRENLAVSISSPLPINKWWSGYLNVWYNYTMNKADFGNGKIVDLNIGGGGLWVQNTFKLAKGWSAEASGWMSVGGTWGIFASKTQGMMNVAVQKKLLKDNATLKIGLDDVFKTAGWRAYATLGTLRMDGRGTWEGQQLKVNFNYRFGNKNVQNARQRKTGLDDERNRVKSGKG